MEQETEWKEDKNSGDYRSDQRFGADSATPLSMVMMNGEGNAVQYLSFASVSIRALLTVVAWG